MEARAVAAALHDYLSGQTTFTDLRQWRGAHLGELATLDDPRAQALALALERAIGHWHQGWPEQRLHDELVRAVREANRRHLWFWEVP